MTWQTIVFAATWPSWLCGGYPRITTHLQSGKVLLLKGKITFSLLFLPHYCSWVFVNDKETFSKFQTDINS